MALQCLEKTFHLLLIHQVLLYFLAIPPIKPPNTAPPTNIPRLAATSPPVARGSVGYLSASCPAVKTVTPAPVLKATLVALIVNPPKGMVTKLIGSNIPATS